MTDARQLAAVRDYDNLIEALRARKVELGLTDVQLDTIAGLPAGYCGKLLGPAQVKKLGPQSLGPMLGALGIELVALVTADSVAAMQKAHERMRERVSERKRAAVAHPVSDALIERVKPAFFRHLSQRAAEARRQKIPPEKRIAIARKAGRAGNKARWRKPKVVEITACVGGAVPEGLRPKRSPNST